MMSTGEAPQSMTVSDEPSSSGRTSVPPTADGSGQEPRRRRSWEALSFSRIGVIYVWIAIIVLFSFISPDTFPTWATVRSVLNQNAISGLIALALVVPLSARLFDLSVGSVTGLANVFVAWMLVTHGVGIVPAVVLTVVCSLGVGLVNAVIVVRIGIDSFIGTLATAALMDALVSLLSKDQSIIGGQLTGGFAKLATTNVAGINLPVLLMFVVAICLWYVQGYTVVGRQIYATGFNERAAELAGINTRRLRFSSLVVSGFVAGIAGVLLASEVGSGSPNIGPPYLLGAYAAAFLGATQFAGRFNSWGTVVAVLLLGTGTTGLTLAGAQPWASSFFTGVVLLAALGLAKLNSMLSVRRSIRARM